MLFPVAAVMRGKMKKREYLLVLSVSILLFSGCGDGESANTVADLPDINGSSTERDSAFLDVQNSLINDDAVHAAGDLIHDAERKTLVRDGLIRESIDYSPLSIEYYAANPSAVLQTAGTAIEGPLELSDFGPVGELPVENRRPNIYVMFNKAMVPLAQLGSPMTESTLLTVDPPLEGVYRWYGTRTLGFRPDRPMLDLPRYTVTVSGDAAALDGEVLGESFTFDIFGERIRMVNFFAGNDADVDVGRWDVPTALAQELTLEFNQPVNPETVGTSLHVSDSRGEIQFSISRPDYPERLLSRTDRAVLLTLEREPEENSSLDISLEEGCCSFRGISRIDEAPVLPDANHQTFPGGAVECLFRQLSRRQPRIPLSGLFALFSSPDGRPGFLRSGVDCGWPAPGARGGFSFLVFAGAQAFRNGAWQAIESYGSGWNQGFIRENRRSEYRDCHNTAAGASGGFPRAL